MIDAQVQFQQALDRRLDDEQKEKVLAEFVEADITENDVAQLIESHAVDKLVSTLKGSACGPQQKQWINALLKVAQKGDHNFELFIAAGGLGVMVRVINEALLQMKRQRLAMCCWRRFAFWAKCPATTASRR